MSLALALSVCIATGSVRADDNDQDKARLAVERGQIRSLDEVLGVVRQRWPGEIVKVELEREDGDWIYEIKILNDEGERQEVEIDATTLKVRKAD